MTKSVIEILLLTVVLVNLEEILKANIHLQLVNEFQYKRLFF